MANRGLGYKIVCDAIFLYIIQQDITLYAQNVSKVQ